MKIKMLDTVEDSHAYGVANKTGKFAVKFDVRKFDKGEVYDEKGQAPEWDRRAASFVNLGYAEIVSED